MLSASNEHDLTRVDCDFHSAPSAPNFLFQGRLFFFFPPFSMKISSRVFLRKTPPFSVFPPFCALPASATKSAPFSFGGPEVLSPPPPHDSNGALSTPRYSCYPQKMHSSSKSLTPPETKIPVGLPPFSPAFCPDSLHCDLNVRPLNFHPLHG